MRIRSDPQFWAGTGAITERGWANEVFWSLRYQPSADGSPHRKTSNTEWDKGQSCLLGQVIKPKVETLHYRHKKKSSISNSSMPSVTTWARSKFVWFFGVFFKVVWKRLALRQVFWTAFCWVSSTSFINMQFLNQELLQEQDIRQWLDSLSFLISTESWIYIKSALDPHTGAYLKGLDTMQGSVFSVISLIDS